MKPAINVRQFVWVTRQTRLTPGCCPKQIAWVLSIGVPAEGHARPPAVSRCKSAKPGNKVRGNEHG